MTLPKSVIEQLQLPLTTRSNSYQIGSGAIETFNTYEGTIHWHDGFRDIIVLESEIVPVVGVGLLWENNLSIDFRHGGDVTITELFDLGRRKEGL